MIYYSKEDHFLVKYDVNFNIEELMNIRKDIINNCGFKSREKEYSIIEEDKFIKSKKHGNNEIIDLVKEDKDGVNKYTYINIKYPRLVMLIDGIICGNYSCLYELLNEYEIENIENFQEKIEILVSDIKHGNYDSLEEANEKIDQARKLVELKELNKDTESTYYYYKQLISKIELTMINCMETEDVLRVRDFLDNNNYYYNEEENKVLKMNKPF